ncbi:STAS/SEC14 domain-containing protein [Nesterenkonia salmonea]|uniref:STAS/SEC14 domain-containing protein n=1 Tax=Nesterenkonia salmonea TaxID=1804987 RepID=A0A5R9B899_9MICC|nr:STAS/SEC14 domain-containing protein [Nesterenkonia salmonea]TLP94188.1 STAS/SEC14 domain-containing protein [Nesterenkonia salmonea]
MIEIIQSPDHVLAVRVSGKVNKEEWETVTSAVEDALRRHDQLALYANFIDLDTMTAGAVLEDIKFSLTNIANFNQFTRLAVVTDASWIEKMTLLGEKVLPDAETRVFAHGEEVAALQWAEEGT